MLDVLARAHTSGSETLGLYQPPCVDSPQHHPSIAEHTRARLHSVRKPATAQTR